MSQAYEQGYRNVVKTAGISDTLRKLKGLYQEGKEPLLEGIKDTIAAPLTNPTSVPSRVSDNLKTLKDESRKAWDNAGDVSEGRIQKLRNKRKQLDTREFRKKEREFIDEIKRREGDGLDSDRLEYHLRAALDYGGEPNSSILTDSGAKHYFKNNAMPFQETNMKLDEISDEIRQLLESRDSMEEVSSNLGQLIGQAAIPTAGAGTIGVGALGYNALKNRKNGSDDGTILGGHGKQTIGIDLNKIL